MMFDNVFLKDVLGIVDIYGNFHKITNTMLHFERLKGMHYVFALSKLLEENNIDEMAEFTKTYEKLQDKGKEDEEAANIALWAMKRKDLFGNVDNAIKMYEEMEKKDG